LTSHDLLDKDLAWAFRRGAAVYPQPVASACGRLVRSRSPEALVDGAIKGAEVLARYLAIVGLASWAARDPASNETLDFGGFHGALSFGHFLAAARMLARTTSDHPLRSHLAAGLNPKGKGKQQKPGPTDDALEKLLHLRNELGHELSSLNRAYAETILAKHRPVELLKTALDGVRGVLGFPLFVVEAQDYVKKEIVVRRLVLMGDSADPIPDSLVVDEGVAEAGAPHVGLKDGALCLHPWTVWRVAPERSNYALFLLDAISDDKLRYKAIETAPLEINGEIAGCAKARLAGESSPAEELTIKSGDNLVGEWLRTQQQREQALKQSLPGISWDVLDEDTLRWFAQRLGGEDGETPRDRIARRLLDGREALGAREITQLHLLFGTEPLVRQILRRPLLDLRVRKSPDERWSERLEPPGNVLQCLRAAVDFFSRHLDLGDLQAEGLQATTGSADYIALREALVNLFLHQDYGEASAAAQIELQPDRATFLNPGFSLIATEHAIDGGKSQARNPLIARALRLIGFAELAGSGIRAVHTAWRKANRRPVRIESDRDANTFLLVLDWREVASTWDTVWKKRLGVQLTSEQAAILDLALGATGIRLEEAAAGSGLRVEDAREALRHLVFQGLLSAHHEHWHLAPHLKELLRSTTDSAEESTSG
jgi:predicted HTH transcriptional regulator